MHAPIIIVMNRQNITMKLWTFSKSLVEKNLSLKTLILCFNFFIFQILPQKRYNKTVTPIFLNTSAILHIELLSNYIWVSLIRIFILKFIWMLFVVLAFLCEFLYIVCIKVFWSILKFLNAFFYKFFFVRSF